MVPGMGNPFAGGNANPLLFPQMMSPQNMNSLLSAGLPMDLMNPEMLAAQVSVIVSM